MDLKLFRQNGPTCGSNAYRTLLSGFGISISEKQAVKEVKNTSDGTYTHNICEALRNRKIPFGLVYLGTDFHSYSRWLYLNSFNRILLLFLHGRSKRTYSDGRFKRGRPSEERHYITISNGLVYDSAHEEIVPLEAYVFKYNDQFTINTMIIVDRPDFKRYGDEGKLV